VETEKMKPYVNTISFWPRRVQLVAAVPSLLLWALFLGITLIWCGGVAISAISGRLAATDNWRFIFLMVMLLFVLICSEVTARTLWRAYQGRSLLWWHACSFGLGIVLLGLIGIVGD
jgi:hypothetical protein